jgi:argininosuccinate synthase
LNGYIAHGATGKSNVTLLGRTSPNSLYDNEVASMDKLGDYDQTNAKGFIKLNALRLKISSR